MIQIRVALTVLAVCLCVTPAFGEGMTLGKAAAASAYLYLKQPERASDLYKDALATDPMNTDPHRNSLAESVKYPEAALLACMQEPTGFTFYLGGHTMTTQTHPSDTLESLMETIGHKDGLIRQRARQSLVAMGAPAVQPLSMALQDSESVQIRWEAAKALGAMGDAGAIPALVKALEDNDSDVTWLAAEGLNAFGKAAWPTLLKALAQDGTGSVLMRKGAHHVLHDQKGDEYEDLLAVLMPALETGALPESASSAALEIMNRMRATE